MFGWIKNLFAPRVDNTEELLDMLASLEGIRFIAKDLYYLAEKASQPDFEEVDYDREGYVGFDAYDDLDGEEYDRHIAAIRAESDEQWEAYRARMTKEGKDC